MIITSLGAMCEDVSTTPDFYFSMSGSKGAVSDMSCHLLAYGSTSAITACGLLSYEPGAFEELRSLRVCHIGQTGFFDPKEGKVFMSWRERLSCQNCIHMVLCFEVPGLERPEIDWRPLETIPEDYYAF